MIEDPEDAENSAMRSGGRSRSEHAPEAWHLAGPTAEKPVLPKAFVASCEAGAQQAETIKKGLGASSSRRRPLKGVSGGVCAMCRQRLNYFTISLLL
jgi:hypothetical protein